MREKVKKYIDNLFADKENNQNTLEIKEELLSNCYCKYDDLIASGMDDSDAFVSVISGIGDIGSLLGELKEKTRIDESTMEKRRMKRALFVSLGVALYIVSVGVLFLLSMISMEEAGLFSMIAICAVATGLIVYGGVQGKEEYTKKDDTIIEELKEKGSVLDRKKSLLKSISSAIWTVTVLLYLAISFSTGLWSVTWIIYLVASIAQQFVAYKLGTEKARQKLWHSILYTSVTIIYFLVSFIFDAWAYSWLIFIAGTAVEQIANIFITYKRTKEVENNG